MVSARSAFQLSVFQHFSFSLQRLSAFQFSAFQLFSSASPPRRRRKEKREAGRATASPPRRRRKTNAQGKARKPYLVLRADTDCLFPLACGAAGTPSPYPLTRRHRLLFSAGLRRGGDAVAPASRFS
jgi:hypothetical protein